MVTEIDSSFRVARKRFTFTRAIIVMNIGDVWYFTLSQTFSDNKDDLYRDSTAKYVDHPVLELTVVAFLEVKDRFPLRLDLVAIWSCAANLLCSVSLFLYLFFDHLNVLFAKCLLNDLYTGRMFNFHNILSAIIKLNLFKKKSRKFSFIFDVGEN